MIEISKHDFEKLTQHFPNMVNFLSAYLGDLQQNKDLETATNDLKSAYQSTERELVNEGELIQSKGKKAEKLSDVIAELKLSTLGIEARERDLVATLQPGAPHLTKDVAPETPVQPR